MAHSKISTHVTVSIALGTGRYLDRLVVGKTGAVQPASYGGIGIYAPASTVDAHLTNFGTISGGAGKFSGNYGHGGAGVVFAARGTIVNHATIAGGAAGFMATDAAGGIGVELLSSGTIVNDGSISGGYAAYKGPAGDGVYLSGGGTLANAGTIAGGSTGGLRQQAGIGVHAATGARVANSGVILGGSAEGPPGFLGYAAAGVYLAAAGKLTNTGTIAGGDSNSLYNGAGGDGVDFGVRGVLRNQGTITGGDGGPVFGGRGGDGVDAGVNGVVINNGSIGGGAGGIGESADRGTGGPGGTGVFLSSGGKLTNGGNIVGGAGGFGHQGGGDGGTGVNVISGGTLTNTGTLLGGVGGGGGGSFQGSGNGGAGGAGVFLQAGGTLEASGVILGGVGGYSGYDASTQAGGVAGAGGAGVDITGGAVLDVTGSVTGGAGGNAAAYDKIVGTPGYGGAGVDFSGNGTLIVSGTVSGGAGGSSPAGASGASGDAVLFGNAAATLVVQAGAVFNGAVAANATVADQLRLGGRQAGSFTGLGTHFTGFSAVAVDPWSSWTFTGTNMLAHGTQLLAAGTLTVTGTLTDSGVLRIVGAGDFQAASAAAVLLDRVALAGGTLADETTATLAVGASASGAGAGIVTVQKGSMISGFGTISSDVLNHGTLLAIGGTLTLDAAVTGDGTAVIAADATLVSQNKLGEVAFDGAATLVLGAPRMAHGPVSGFGAGDVIDVRKLDVTSISYQNGTLALAAGAITDHIAFDGSYSIGDFSFGADGSGGTDILFAAAGETSRHPAASCWPREDGFAAAFGWGALHHIL